jgi:hypothetical protein
MKIVEKKDKEHHFVNGNVTVRDGHRKPNFEPRSDSMNIMDPSEIFHRCPDQDLSFDDHQIRKILEQLLDCFLKIKSVT